MTTRIAIVGVGRWGGHFVRNFWQHPRSNVIAIVDNHPEHLFACQKKLNLSENQVHLFSNWQEIHTLERVDAVVIATPATTHYDLIKDALKHGYHVLAEKPLTLNTEQCRELTQLAQQRQCQLFVDHTYLFHPAVQQGKQMLDSEDLGEFRYGYASRTHLGPVRQDVDALWDLAIHDIAIFNHWLGESPTQVQARGNVWLQPDRGDGQGLADLVWATLKYPSGFEAQLHFCWNNPDKQRRLCLVGEKGTLIFNEMLKDKALSVQWGQFQRQGERFIPSQPNTQQIPFEGVEPLGRVCEAFLSAIEAGKPCLAASGEKATQLVKVLEALSFSLNRQGQSISIKY